MSEGLVIGSGGFAKGLGRGLSALIWLLSIDGNRTRWVRGAHRLMGGEGGGSIDVDLSLSIDGWFMQSINFDVKRGGWVRVFFFCEFLMSHDSNCTTLHSRFSR